MYGPQKSFIHSFSLFKKKKNILRLKYLRQIVKNRISSSFKLSFKLRLKENVRIYLERWTNSISICLSFYPSE